MPFEDPDEFLLLLFFFLVFEEDCPLSSEEASTAGLGFLSLDVNGFCLTAADADHNDVDAVAVALAAWPVLEPPPREGNIDVLVTLGAAGTLLDELPEDFFFLSLPPLPLELLLLEALAEDEFVPVFLCFKLLFPEEELADELLLWPMLAGARPTPAVRPCCFALARP